LREDCLGAFRARHSLAGQRGQSALAEETLLLPVKAAASNEIAHRESVRAGAGTGGDNTDEY
jgi:hypothetical protein